MPRDRDFRRQIETGSAKKDPLHILLGAIFQGTVAALMGPGVIPQTPRSDMARMDGDPS